MLGYLEVSGGALVVRYSGWVPSLGGVEGTRQQDRALGPGSSVGGACLALAGPRLHVHARCCGALRGAKSCVGPFRWWWSFLFCL